MFSYCIASVDLQLFSKCSIGICVGLCWGFFGCCFDLVLFLFVLGGCFVLISLLTAVLESL